MLCLQIYTTPTAKEEEQEIIDLLKCWHDYFDLSICSVVPGELVENEFFVGIGEVDAESLSSLPVDRCCLVIGDAGLVTDEHNYYSRSNLVPHLLQKYMSGVNSPLHDPDMAIQLLFGIWEKLTQSIKSITAGEAVKHANIRALKEVTEEAWKVYIDRKVEMFLAKIHKLDELELSNVIDEKNKIYEEVFLLSPEDIHLLEKWKNELYLAGDSKKGEYVAIQIDLALNRLIQKIESSINEAKHCVENTSHREAIRFLNIGLALIEERKMLQNEKLQPLLATIHQHCGELYLNQDFGGESNNRNNRDYEKCYFHLSEAIKIRKAILNGNLTHFEVQIERAQTKLSHRKKPYI